MCKEDMNLDELEELKDTFHLMDEKLDGQEIVTAEQIRLVTEKKTSVLKHELQSSLIGLYCIGIPFLLLLNYLNHRLSVTALCTGSVFCALSIAVCIFLLCRINRKGFAGQDLRTLMRSEQRYRRAYLFTLLVSVIFWIVFSFVVKGKVQGITVTFFVLLIILPARWDDFVISFKTGLKESYGQSDSKMRRFGKAVVIILEVLIFLILLAFTVLSIIGVFKTADGPVLQNLSWDWISAILLYLTGTLGIAAVIIYMVRKKDRLSLLGTVCFSIMALAFLVRVVGDKVNGKSIDPSTMLPVIMIAFVAVILRRRK